MDSVLDYLIKQGENYLKDYRDFIKDKLIPKRFEEGQQKRASFIFLKLKRYLKDKHNIRVLENQENEDHTNGPYFIALNKNKAIVERLKELIDKYAWHKLNFEELQVNTEDDLKKIELKAKSVDYLVYRRFDIEAATNEMEEDYYFEEENEEEFCEEVAALAHEVIKDIDNALSYELENELERGDVVEIIDPNTNDEEENSSLMFVLEKQGELYTAFKITEDEEPYVTSVKFEKDNVNNLGKDGYMQMNTKYLINKSEVVNKIGHASAEALNKIDRYAELFESKNLTREFVGKSINKVQNTISIRNKLKIRNE